MSTRSNNPVSRVPWKQKLFTEVRDLNKELYNGRVPDLAVGMLKRKEEPGEQHPEKKPKR